MALIANFATLMILAAAAYVLLKWMGGGYSRGR